ncbi:Co2+/Mg2+ efflux protein ApaG [Pseudahrensia aquimaris]|uniref:Protein ApaG n=1 Tax=Pseudahrensia aquimaris TaxID=744461 RepID=A0ABW3FH41_9HYPH
MSKASDTKNHYESVTNSIRVVVQPSYLEDQSAPHASRWVWAYSIEIFNEGQETVQLRARHWTITDAMGKVETVDGPGVVGEQPILNPGDEFHYTSGCPLATPSGFMVGHYEMVRDDGSVFEAAIPAFSLDLPNARASLN